MKVRMEHTQGSGSFLPSFVGHMQCWQEVNFTIVQMLCVGVCLCVCGGERVCVCLSLFFSLKYLINSSARHGRLLC